MHFFKNDDNFAKIFGFCADPVAIVMKMYSLGTLKDLIFQQNQSMSLRGVEYSNSLVTSLATNIAGGLLAMHKAGFAHHDIKPANILLDHGNKHVPLQAVLTDFGISRIVTDASMLVYAFQKSRIQGASISYAAPDILEDMMSHKKNDTLARTESIATGYGHSKRQERLLRADCYSFGIVVFEMLTCKPAWPCHSDEIIRNVIRGQRPQWPEDVLQRSQADDSVETLRGIVESCWLQDPLSRMTINSVLMALSSTITKIN